MGSPTPIEGRCGAKLPGKGEYCTKPPCKGRTRCRRHGGRSLRGAEHPNYKHGRHTRLFGSLREDYEAAISDPDLLSMREDVALIDAMVSDLLGRMKEGGAPNDWYHDIRKKARAFRDAFDAGNVTKMRETFAPLFDTIEDAAQDVALMNSIVSMLEKKSRLVQREHKRLIDIQSVMTGREVLGLVGEIVKVIGNNVTDRHTLDAIILDVEALGVSAVGPAVEVGTRQSAGPDESSMVPVPATS